MGKHDLQFRNTFKDPDLFRQACAIYLPPDIKDKLKLETLKLRQLSGNFIRNLIITNYGVDPDKDPKTFEQLKNEIADIVYLCECYDSGDAMLIAHFEHQSTPDQHYAIRNALYDISALKDYVDTEKPNQYTIIISLMIYHGKTTPYPYHTDIIKQFKHQGLAEKYFLKPILVDYGQYTDHELLKHGEISGLEIAFKHAFDNAIDNDVITNLMRGLKKCAKIELIRDWYMYALRTWESPAKTMLSKYQEYLTNDEGFIVTAAEQLKQQGVDQGIKIGIEKGMEKGIEKGALIGKTTTAKNMLQDGLSLEMVAKYSGLSTAILTNLKKEVSKAKH